jgi:hypothetical protein
VILLKAIGWLIVLAVFGVVGGGFFALGYSIGSEAHLVLGIFLGGLFGLASGCPAAMWVSDVLGL